MLALRWWAAGSADEDGWELPADVTISANGRTLRSTNPRDVLVTPSLGWCLRRSTLTIGPLSHPHRYWLATLSLGPPGSPLELVRVEGGHELDRCAVALGGNKALFEFPTALVMEIRVTGPRAGHLTIRIGALSHTVPIDPDSRLIGTATFS